MNYFAMLERFDRARHEVHVVSALAGRTLAGPGMRGETTHGVPPGGARRCPWRQWRARVGLMRTLRGGAYDVVHTWTPEAGYWGRLAARRCRVPVVIHTHLELPVRPFTPAWKHALFVAREHRVRSATDWVISSCEAVQAEARELGLVEGDRCQVVYPGVDYASLDRHVDTVVLRRDLAVPDSWSMVLTAGPLDRQRAPELLIEAMRELVPTHPRTQLLIAGTGPRRARLEDLIVRLGLSRHVRLLGACLSVPALVRAADVFAVASRGEDLGQARRVAMLLGKPVVAAEGAGVSELVHHGQTGLLYESGKAHQLASHLRYLLDHPTERYRLGVNARRLTRPLFDVSLTASRLGEIYDRLLARLDCRRAQRC
ncbi:MAG: glycosyltransferase family 4 protein [Verrucomicrobia bacterium]|nr:glycosyltransferase family 4 protein [Verrucomicrobiota bacterium]